MEANKENLNKNIIEIFKAEYTIPLYQRNFAWRETQISRLLCDVYESYTKNPDGNYFLGSLVVRKTRDDSYEVIDGQQRLTVLSLITKILGICNELHLSYESRPQVENFLQQFYEGKNNIMADHPSTVYLREAVNIIQTTNISEETEGQKKVTIYDDKGNINKPFAEYFAKQVILVRVELPEDTDVTSYFEIMNNRGEQLQEHEILKSLLLAKIKSPDGTMYDLDKQKEFSIIWDACSQMDEPVQKVLNTKLRRKYFGEAFDNFVFSGLESGYNKQNIIQGFTLEALINNEDKNSISDYDNIEDENYEFEDETAYSSIIDFPNFIMHVLKAFYENLYKDAEGGKPIPLDAKYMLHIFYRIKDKIDSEQFIGHLFRTKVFFDRYIVKTTSDDEDVSWSLTRIKLTGKQKIDFVSTFDDQSLQQRILQAQTMLQVTFRQKKYKRWLQEAIKWFARQNSINIDGWEYLKFLDKHILDRYDEDGTVSTFQPIEEGAMLTKENSYSLGEGTPHFILNFIDYLYWVEKKNPFKHNIKHSDMVIDFVFKYWNSVEHHLARHTSSFEERGNKYVDNLGNLFLVYRSTNSRLNDRLPIQKVSEYADKNMGANRRIIYKLTEINKQWGEKDITEHYNDLLELLNKRKDILMCIYNQQ